MLRCSFLVWFTSSSQSLGQRTLPNPNWLGLQPPGLCADEMAPFRFCCIRLNLKRIRYFQLIFVVCSNLEKLPSQQSYLRLATLKIYGQLLCPKPVNAICFIFMWHQVIAHITNRWPKCISPDLNSCRGEDNQFRPGLLYGRTYCAGVMVSFISCRLSILAAHFLFRPPFWRRNFVAFVFECTYNFH